MSLTKEESSKSEVASFYESDSSVSGNLSVQSLNNNCKTPNFKMNLGTLRRAEMSIKVDEESKEFIQWVGNSRGIT